MEQRVKKIILLGQCYPKIFCDDKNVQYDVLSNTVANSHTWLISTWYVASENKGLIFKFYIIWINPIYIWLEGLILHSVDLGN